MTSTEQLALEGADALICEAQSILAAYLPPDSPQDAEETVNLLRGIEETEGFKVAP